ncbi:hypothetical protein FHT44_006159 [Mycolicibacterium sp. BK634]|uniref:hypothetical protein n=1 Tax=Mycolicibacterium sp. BK634 TaxID=2587099 RepID=UPI001620D386|nr:hypothetical protein [Mycolicibacterium sp. BK634]MBB3753637.1 hypothetical protein [Mycolicibacterium sp. BK634]
MNSSSADEGGHQLTEGLDGAGLLMERSASTAVVVVHGMGEQRPLDTINSFIKTGLKPFGDPTDPKARARIYYSRPALLAKSFQARRLLAIARVVNRTVEQTQTEFFEYHWSYRMTGNKISDLVSTVARLMWRPIRRAPTPLRALWLVMWAAVIGLSAYIWSLLAHHKIDEISLKSVVGSLFPNGAVAAFVVALILGLAGWLTSTFVDVVRYLDTSPRSYAVRESIRGGMVDLLKALTDSGRYNRIVVVAHSLGGYIAYDAMTSLWNEIDRGEEELATLQELQDRANALPQDPSAPVDETALIAFRSAQYELWKEMRDKRIGWLITDFITVGTPMYFADLLYTKNRAAFDELRKRSELPQCPPRSDSQTIEGTIVSSLKYGWRGQKVLVTGSPFAAVRWSNYWFPTRWFIFGDWFGGPLRPLFGAGIEERAIQGNTPGRLIPAGAHTRYFRYPNSDGDNDIAPAIRGALALQTEVAPNGDAETDDNQ